MLHEMLVHTVQGTIRIFQSLCILTFQIRMIDRIGQTIGFMQQRIIQHRIVRLRTHRKKQTHQYCQHTSHSLRQTEIETASLAHLTFNLETAYTEHLIGLPVLFDDTLAVHQAETTSLTLLQSIHIRSRPDPNLARIVNLFIQDASHIFFRQSRAIVLHRNFHIICLLTSVYLNASTRLSILSGILGQRINHEQSQRLIRFHPNISRLHRKRLLLCFKIPSSLFQHLKQWIQSKIFDIQTQRTLTHLNPQSQDIVVFIDACDQFADVLEFGLLDFLLRQVIERNQFMHFIYHAVDIRCNPRHNEQASLLDQVLTLVFYQMLFMYILLLLQTTALFTQSDDSQSVFQRPGKVGNNHFEQRLILLLHLGFHTNLPKTDRQSFRILQHEREAVLHYRNYPIFNRDDFHIRCSHQPLNLFLYRRHNGLNHIFHRLSIR